MWEIALSKRTFFSIPSNTYGKVMVMHLPGFTVLRCSSCPVATWPIVANNMRPFASSWAFAWISFWAIVKKKKTQRNFFTTHWSRKIQWYCSGTNAHSSLYFTVSHDDLALSVHAQHRCFRHTNWFWAKRWRITSKRLFIPPLRVLAQTLVNSTRC